MANTDEIDLVGAYRTYSADIRKEIEAAAERLGREMLEELRVATPVGKHEYKGLRKRYRKSERRIPGQLKNDWKLKKTSSDGKVSVKAYAAKDSSGIVHLIDRGHRMPRGGNYPGKPFVTEIQKKYREKLCREIERILSK